MTVLELLGTLGERRKGVYDKIWELLAYGAAQGHQPLSELRALPLHELTRFTAELSKLFKKE